MITDTETVTHDNVKEYYGQTLDGTQDLKTGACCTDEALPLRHREILAKISDEVMSRFYGCGSPIPPAIEGCTVLDLGCGTGRDVFLAACLAGENGKVIGVDMTDEQLSVARSNADAQMDTFGLPRENVAFKAGYIENLAAAGIEDNSVDLVISNCVINLSPDKSAVLKEIFRVLKPGGELYFSDVYADRRVPQSLRDDPVLYGECLSGALYIEDFRRILRDIGCLDYRIVNKRRIELTNPEIEAKAGMIGFYSITIRAFKLDCLEDICEDFGQVAIYNGTIDDCPHAFELDDHHLFHTGKPMLVCGNSAAMVQDTRYGKHFTVIGDRSVHYGVFDCSSDATAKSEEGACC